MSLRWSNPATTGMAVALALLVGCGGESVQSVGDNSGRSAAGTGTIGLGGTGSSSSNPGGTGPTDSRGGTGMGAGGRTAGGGSVSNTGARGGAPSAMAGTSGTASAMAGTSGTASAMAGTSGTPPDPPPPDPPPPDPPPPATWDTIKLVLTGTSPPCTGAACHGGSGGKIHLGFPVKNDAQLYKVLTEYVSKDCGNFPIVTPGHPEMSALVMVLKGPCSEDVPRMPNGCDDEQGNCVPDEYIAAVEQWIADGAQSP